MQHDLAPTEMFDPYFLQTVVQQATELLNVDGCGFYFWDPAQRQATLVAQNNLPDIPWDQKLPYRVITSQKTIVETRPHRPVSLAVPAVWHDDARGVLVVTDKAPERIFCDKDVKILKSLADLVASVSRQTQRLARMTAQFRALHVIDIALTSSLQLDRVLNLILEKAVELVGAEHGSLRQFNPKTGELVLKTHHGAGWTREALAYTPRAGEGIAHWVTKHRRPYLSPDVRKDPRNVVLFEDMRSSVAVPLLNTQGKEPDTDEFLGVLLLESSRLAAFDQQDVELLDALAQEAVIAIQNATQHQKLQSMHRKLKTEQEKRLAVEKWTFMGQAATSLAHRINNLIGIVPASAKEVHQALSKTDLSKDDRDWIEENLSRIERNARFILKLSDVLFRPFKETGPLVCFDVNMLLNKALESADLPPTLQVIRSYGQELPKVESRPLLVDIFLELITNAKKAMEDQSRSVLRIRSRCESVEAERWIVVEISDTGRGIPSTQMEHLWDMFQQSKDGLGFGLWWLRTFIERQGGKISCTSRPKQGATFTIRLPGIGDQES